MSPGKTSEGARKEGKTLKVEEIANQGGNQRGKGDRDKTKAIKMRRGCKGGSATFLKEGQRPCGAVSFT